MNFTDLLSCSHGRACLAWRVSPRCSVDVPGLTPPVAADHYSVTGADAEWAWASVSDFLAAWESVAELKSVWL
jgi:hypothetical protein